MNTVNKRPQQKPIAILGGTFDPIHYGHLKPAQHMAQELDLGRVVLLPAHIPPHKSATSACSTARAEMVELVCQQETLFELDDRELTRDKPSYTLDTLRLYKKEHPDRQLLFFIGMDSLLTFTTWHQWQEILTLCHLVVCPRPGYRATAMDQQTLALLAKHQVSDKKALLEKESGGILIVPPCDWNISSTEIRARLKTRQDCADIMPGYILDYINRHQLYR